MQQLFLTKEEIASLLGITRQAVAKNISKYEKKYPITVKDGKIKLADYLQAFRKNCTEMNISKVNEALKIVKLEQEKIKLEVEKGNYIPIAEVDEEWGNFAKNIKQALLTLEAKISHKISYKSGKPIPTVRKIIRDEVYLMLNEFSKTGKYRTKINDNLPLDLQIKLTEQFFDKLHEIPKKKYKALFVDIKT